MAEVAHTLNLFFKKQQNDNLNLSRKYVIAAFKEIAENIPKNSRIPINGLPEVFMENDTVIYRGECASIDRMDRRYEALVQNLFNKHAEVRKSWPEISDIEIMDNVLNDAAVTAQNAKITIKGKYFPNYSWEVGQKLE